MFRRGDSNNDGRVDLSDAIAILNYLYLGDMNITCVDSADTNDDSKLNITDPIFLLNNLFIEFELIPNPTVFNYDPTEDDGINCDSYRANEALVEVLSTEMLSAQALSGARNFPVGNLHAVFESRESGLEKTTFSSTILRIMVHVTDNRAKEATGVSRLYLADSGGNMLTQRMDPVWEKDFVHEDGSIMRFGRIFLNDSLDIQGNAELFLRADISTIFLDGEYFEIYMTPTHDIATEPFCLVGPDSYTLLGKVAIASSTLSIRESEKGEGWRGTSLPKHFGVFSGGLVFETGIDGVYVRELSLYARQVNSNTYGTAHELIRNIRLIWMPADEYVELAVLGMNEFEKDSDAITFLFEDNFYIPSNTQSEVFVLIDTNDLPAGVKTGQLFELSLEHNTDVIAHGKLSAQNIEVDAEKIVFEPAVMYRSLPLVYSNEWVHLAINNHWVDESPEARGVEDGQIALGEEVPLYRFLVRSDIGSIALLRVTAYISGWHNISISNPSIRLNGKIVAVPEFGSGGASDQWWSTSTTFTFVNDGGDLSPHHMPEHTTSIFTLHATVTLRNLSEPYRLEVSLRGNEEFPLRFPETAENMKNFFVWSDYSLSGPEGYNDPNTMALEQWTNGKNVLGLDSLSKPVVFSNEM